MQKNATKNGNSTKINDKIDETINEIDNREKTNVFDKVFSNPLLTKYGAKSLVFLPIAIFNIALVVLKGFIFGKLTLLGAAALAYSLFIKATDNVGVFH